MRLMGQTIGGNLELLPQPGIGSNGLITELYTDNNGEANLIDSVNTVQGFTNQDVLLLHMEGDDNGQVFVDSSDGNAVRRGIIGTSCGYFDGAGGYLTLPFSDDFRYDLNSDLVTIEFWFYKTEAEIEILFYKGELANMQTAGDILIYSLDTGVIQVHFREGAVNSSYNTSAYELNTWYHIAVVIDSGCTIYVNGVDTNASATTFGGWWLQTVLFIGGYTNGAYAATTYMDEVRVSDGIARYTTDFVPQTTPFTSDANTVLLLHMDNDVGSTAFDDDGNTGHSVTTNGNVIQVEGHGVTAVADTKTENTQKKFGVTSGYFDGTGDYLTVPDSGDWDFGSGDFTIDFWAYIPSLPGTFYCFISHGTNATNVFSFLVYSDGKYYVQLKVADSNVMLMNMVGTMVAETWTHLALVKEGSTYTLYDDGVSINDETYATAWPDFTGLMTIGYRLVDTSYPMAGYIDELRISKGIARWTANFQVPEAPHTSVFGQGTIQTNKLYHSATPITSLLVDEICDKNQPSSRGTVDVSFDDGSSWSTGSNTIGGDTITDFTGTSSDAGTYKLKLKMSLGETYAGADKVWSTTGSLTVAKAQMVGCGTTSDALCVGGDTGAVINITEIWSGSSWATTGSLTLSKKFLSGCGTTGAALSFGGNSATVVDTTEIWNATSWATTTVLTAVVGNHVGCGTTSDALSFGGDSTGSDAFVDITEIWNGSIWATTTALTQAKGWLTGCGTASAALCIGGYTNSTNVTTTEIWNGSIWATTTSINTGSRDGAGCGTTSNALYYGGYTSANSNKTEIWSGSSWATTTTLVESKRYFGGCGIASDALSIGGNTGAIVSTTERWHGEGIQKGFMAKIN
jgi:hypothetical protein